MENNTVWTAGFFNERFPQPVSPLGWSIIAPLVEEIAFRDPLSYLGCRDLPQWRILRLYNGHLYVNMAVFQTLYKVFPEGLLPEDAARYFPGGNTRLRRQAPYPCCLLDPRFLISALLAFLRDPGNWSPWHNYRKWEDFQLRHATAMAQIAAQIAAKSPVAGCEPGAVTKEDLQHWFDLLEQLHCWDKQLLRIHRWSLTHADIFYTLLRRLLAAWVDGKEAPALAAALTSGITNRSLEVDAALRRLAGLARDNFAVHQAIVCGDPSLLGDEPASRDFLSALDDFLVAHGHRSFSLDIFHPTFRDDPSQVLSLLHGMLVAREGVSFNVGGAKSGSDEALRVQTGKARRSSIEALAAVSPVKRAVLQAILSLARRYLPLREDQRYAWQKSLALQRRIYLSIGQVLAARGLLQAAEDVFFLTAEEVKQAALLSLSSSPETLARQRKAEFGQLLASWQRDPQGHYPPFLLGDEPLPEGVVVKERATYAQQQAPLQGTIPAMEAGLEAGEVFRGHPVSPGVARGLARVVHGPAEFRRIKRGDILVVTSTDPGWTPIFPFLGGLVMERGGLLSHGAVVAREYGLPAVTGVAGITGIVRDGEPLLVDGNAGIVARLRHNQAVAKRANHML